MKNEDKDEDERPETGGLSRIYVLLAVGCVTLLLAGGGFVYWQSRDGEGAMPLTALQADRSATLLPAPAPHETAPPAAAPAPVSATSARYCHQGADRSHRRAAGSVGERRAAENSRGRERRRARQRAAGGGDQSRPR